MKENKDKINKTENKISIGTREDENDLLMFPLTLLTIIKQLKKMGKKTSVVKIPIMVNKNPSELSSLEISHNSLQLILFFQ